MEEKSLEEAFAQPGQSEAKEKNGGSKMEMRLACGEENKGMEQCLPALEARPECELPGCLYNWLAELGYQA